MKKLKKLTARILTGIAALCLLAGCADITGSPSSEKPEVPANTGRVVISITGAGEPSGTESSPGLARTMLPVEDYMALVYTFEFTADGKTPVSGLLTEGAVSAELEAGTWNLAVTGKREDNTEILEGSVTGIEINAGESKSVSVTMTNTGTASGALDYSVTFPDTVSRGFLRVFDLDDTPLEEIDLAGGTATDNDDGTKTAGGSLILAKGYYRAGLEMFKPDGALSRTVIAHIYPSLTTAVEYTFTNDDFIPATVDSSKTTFAATLGEIKGLSNDSNNVYFLSVENEDMSRINVSNTNGPVSVTIDGGGRTVNLNGTGSLITVGNNVTLVLKNITLRGLEANNAPLLMVAAGGKLETRTGVLIADNNNTGIGNSVSYVYGGGVYVDENAAFTMSGGKITGNTAFASCNYTYASSYAYGGGVYVKSGGTFNINDGEIKGNTAYASSDKLSSTFLL